jgi:hypothetical protein
MVREGSEIIQMRTDTPFWQSATVPWPLRQVVRPPPSCSGRVLECESGRIHPKMNAKFDPPIIAGMNVIMAMTVKDYLSRVARGTVEEDLSFMAIHDFKWPAFSIYVTKGPQNGYL